MPRRSYRRKPKTKRNFVSRAARTGMKYVTKGGTAYKALKLARRLADAVNTEYKLYDVNTTVTPDYTGAIYEQLTSIAQGVQASQRVGSSLKIQNNIFRAELTRGSVDCNVRIIWFWDPQNVITTTAQLLQTVGSVYSTLSPKNYSYRFQTKVLFDRNYNLTTDSPQKICNFVKPINKHTNYSGNSATVLSGMLKMIIISDVNASLPSVKFFNRITYTDN